MAIHSLCIFNAFRIPFLIQANIVVLYLLFPCSCSAYETSYSASPASSTGYVYTMALEHSLLVYTMAVEHALLVYTMALEHSFLEYRLAVEHSLLVYRMAVEHSLLRRRRSGT